MQPIIKKVLITMLVMVSAYGMTLIPRSSAGKNSSMSKFVKAKNTRMEAQNKQKYHEDSRYYKKFKVIF